jgi:hypothetical protein
MSGIPAIGLAHGPGSLAEPLARFNASFAARMPRKGVSPSSRNPAPSSPA